jgi:hypothetical protein
MSIMFVRDHSTLILRVQRIIVMAILMVISLSTVDIKTRA